MDGRQENSMKKRGLEALDNVALGDKHVHLLEDARQSVAGPPAWRKRKLAEIQDLLAMSEIVPRLDVVFIDCCETLRAIVHMEVPVPLNPCERSGRLRTAPAALLGLMVPEHAIREPLPGYTFVQILDPKGVWHANVSAENVQFLCLGVTLPAGIGLKDILLMTYGALSMQSVMVDEADAAGVMNVEAARWWQQNMDLIPLSREPFLQTQFTEADHKEG